jgi:hypothetical protein
MTRALGVVAAALAAAALSGCMGDGGGEAADPVTEPQAASTSPSTTTSEAGTGTDAQRAQPASAQSRWANQVDKACRRWQEQIEAVEPPSDPAAVAPALAQTLPLIRKEIAAVKSVREPETRDEARTARLFVRSLERLERALKKYLRAVRGNDDTAVAASLVEIDAAGTQARTYALVLELTHCGAG